MSEADRLDAIVVTNSAVRLMRHWASGPVVEEYSLDTRCFEVPMRSSAGRGFAGQPARSDRRPSQHGTAGSSGSKIVVIHVPWKEPQAA